MSIAEKLATIADNEFKVYNAGYIQGNDDGYWVGYYDGYGDGVSEAERKYQEGYNQGHGEGWDAGWNAGIEDGKTAEYDRFWNGYQENGNRRNYAYAFNRRGWTDETYKPKYPVIVTGNAEQMYRECRMTSLSGVDTSGATSVYIAFYNTKLQTIDKLDFSKATNTQNAFAHSVDLHTIGEIVSSETTVWHTTTFDNCAALENLNITGTIATNFTCKISSLTTESVISILNHLKAYPAGSGTHTCTIGTTNINKVGEAGMTVATQRGWTLV